VRISLVDATGASVIPASPLLSSQWPHAIAGQRAAPLGTMHIKDGATTTVGIAAAVVDTTASRMSFTWIPVSFIGTTPANAPVELSEGIGSVSGSNAINSVPSAPAVGDIDHDGDDEAVVTTPAGTVFVIDFASAFSASVIVETGQLRAANPSAPALGDVDGDGTLEIAVWDEAYLYLLKSNARPLVEWPRPIRPESAGAAPATHPVRAFESPLVADLDGAGPEEVLFALDDGTLFGLDVAGDGVSGFPRVTPAEAGAAPSLSPPGDFGGLVFLGSAGRMQSADAVTDTVAIASETVLSIQSFPGGPATPSWPMARADLARSGRVTNQSPGVASASGAYDEASFIIYPNPVKETTVRARVTTNARAEVAVSILNLEGEEAFSRSFSVNPNGLPNTPFDEAIDVAGLKSGVYLMRLRIESSAGSGSLVKTFAIRR
jgi:hypothetical protein